MNEKLLRDLVLEAKKWSDAGVPDKEIDESFILATEGFGSLLGTGVIETIKRKIARWALKYFGVDLDGFMALVFENAFANLEFKDYGKVFKDCDFTTTLLAETMIDAMADKVRTDKGLGGDVFTGVQAMVMDALGGLNAVQTIKDKMTDLVCPKLADVRKSIIEKVPFLDKII